MKFLQIPIEHLDHFGFNSRVIALAQHFDPNLAELPVSSLLRAFAAKLRPDVEKLYQTRLIEQAVFDVCSNGGRRRLGTERDEFTVPVLERIHLFVDIGLGSDPPFEQLGLLHDWSADLLKAIPAECLTSRALDEIPAVYARLDFFSKASGKKILRPANP